MYVNSITVGYLLLAVTIGRRMDRFQERLLVLALMLWCGCAVAAASYGEQSAGDENDSGHIHGAHSCRDLGEYDMPTGEYHIHLRGTPKWVRVWCEMALGSGGGGYTFVHPREFYLLSPEEQKSLLAQIYTHTGDVLMRVRKNDGRQPYTVLKQLTTRRSNPLFVGASEHTGHNAPVNKKTMGSPFLYLGFIPISDGRVKGARQGLTSNDRQCAFTNCDANPNNYIALFPNLKEKPASNYHYAPDGWGTTGPCGCIRSSLKHNPSGHVMPEGYFMFTEMHFGGCGCYGQTDHTSNVMLGSALGFR